jgi:serine protease Do
MRYIALLIIVFISGCTTAKVIPIDDYKVKRKMETGIKTLKESDKLVDPKVLVKQLSRKSCDITLPSGNIGKMTPKEIYKNYRDSTLLICAPYKCKKCPKWHVSASTGFVLTSDGVAVTNYHVMASEGGRYNAAMTFDGKMYPITEVLAADKNSDIAIIKIDADNLTPSPVTADNEVGTPVTAITHPNGGYFSLSQGVVSRHFMSRKAHWMSITADYSKGSSGGPIYNDKGEVAGMVSSTRSIYYSKDKGIDKNLQMVVKVCVPSQSILKLIKPEDE